MRSISPGPRRLCAAAQSSRSPCRRRAGARRGRYCCCRDRRCPRDRRAAPATAAAPTHRDQAAAAVTAPVRTVSAAPAASQAAKSRHAGSTWCRPRPGEAGGARTAPGRVLVADPGDHREADWLPRAGLADQLQPVSADGTQAWMPINSDQLANATDHRQAGAGEEDGPAVGRDRRRDARCRRLERHPSTTAPPTRWACSSSSLTAAGSQRTRS